MEGDFFCFELEAGGFGCGRILAKVSLGHSVEIFSGVENSPDYTPAWLKKGVAFYDIVDSYSLFDKKKEGDWRVVASGNLDSDFDFDAAFFGYGTRGDRQKVNLAGTRSPCDEEVYLTLPPYRPAGNKSIVAKFVNF